MIMSISTLKKMLSALESMSIDGSVTIDMAKDGNTIRLSNGGGNEIVYVSDFCIDCKESYID